MTQGKPRNFETWGGGRWSVREPGVACVVAVSSEDAALLCTGAFPLGTSDVHFRG